MARRLVNHFVLPLLTSVQLHACLPNGDLDEAASGSRGAGAGGWTTNRQPDPAQAGAAASDSGDLQAIGGAASPLSGGGAGEGSSNPWGSGGSPAGGAPSSSGGAGISEGGAIVIEGGAPPSVGGSAGDAGEASLAEGGTQTSAGGAPIAIGGASDTGGTSAAVGGALPQGAAGTGGAAQGAGGSSSSSGGSDGGGGTTIGPGGYPTTEGGSTADGGIGGAAGTPTTTGGTTGGGGSGHAGAGFIAPDLPDLPSSPVDGGINYSSGASWDINGIQVPAFEIHTPTASYWLVKSAAAIVEITDVAGRKWISFSSGYRPNRGIPNLGGCCQPGDPSLMGMPEMVTEVDERSVTLTHLRLVSKPVDGDYYWLVWDFYLTHVTVTINRAAEPYGFTYHGVPGGNLDPEDQLGFSTGEVQSASVGYAEDLPGPAEWVFLTSPSASANSALFLIQHGDDALPESYGVADANSSKFVFGRGDITDTPTRFSLGIVDSVGFSAISDRVTYVVDSTPPMN